MGTINRASLVSVQPGTEGTKGNEVSKRSVGIVPHDNAPERSMFAANQTSGQSQETEPLPQRDTDFLARVIGALPTRYRVVVLTSLPHGARLTGGHPRATAWRY